MNKKLFIFLILLLASNEIVYGKHNKTKTEKESKTNKNVISKTSDRTKRSTSIKTFFQNLPNEDDIITHNKLAEKLKSDNIEDEIPFWGARGRRESSSAETLGEIQMPYEKYCPHNSKRCFLIASKNYKNENPFWGQRGRRNDIESDENNIDFLEDRLRRQDEKDDPFWGSRGRRFQSTMDNNYSQWKSRSLHEDDDTPFWGNRGRRKMSDTKSNIHDDPEPFWGNRGKKDKNNQQLLDEEDPFWANRGKREKDFNYKLNPKMSALDNDFENIPEMKGPEIATSFWANRGRDSKLRYLFNGARGRVKPDVINKEMNVGYHIKPSEQNTIQDDRIYAEEPHYILIERSSRSSREDDPYIISRGKKQSNRVAKNARGRRGALEDIVKSVQKDPYYIARGKKDSYLKLDNMMSLENLRKDKEVVCGIIYSILNKNERIKIKRDANDSERDRRTILKKLAAQLQEDPYFVSRGKKDTTDGDEKNLQAYINEIVEMCN